MKYHRLFCDNLNHCFADGFFSVLIDTCEWHVTRAEVLEKGRSDPFRGWIEAQKEGKWGIFFFCDLSINSSRVDRNNSVEPLALSKGISLNP